MAVCCFQGDAVHDEDELNCTINVVPLVGHHAGDAHHLPRTIPVIVKVVPDDAAERPRNVATVTKAEKISWSR